jgi:preprotein translocase subunit YajC
MVPSLFPLIAEGESPAGGGLGMFPIIIIVFAIFYFIVIRPGSKERKQREAQVSALKKHDKVITNGGLHGTVVAIEGDVVVIRVDDKNNIRMRYSKSAIWQVVQPSDKASEAPDKKEKKEA